MFISLKNLPKDKWDKGLIVAKIMGAVFIPLLIVIGTVIINSKLKSIDQNLDWQKHDLAIMQEFHQSYPDQNTRGLSLCYVSMIHDEETRWKLHEFIAWDIFKRHFKRTNSSLTKDDTDWHCFGENLAQMIQFKNKKHDGRQFYCNFKRSAPKIILGSNTPQTDNLFKSLEKTYVVIESGLQDFMKEKNIKECKE